MTHVRSVTLRNLEALLDEGWALTQQADAASEPARSRRFQEAGARYEATQILIQVVKFGIDVAIVISHADAAGVPFGALRSRLRAFDDDMLPLVQAALSFSPARMRGTLAQVEAKYQQAVEALDQSMRVLDKNTPLSRQVIQIANVLTLALALYDVARIPVVKGGGGDGDGRIFRPGPRRSMRCQG